MSYECFDVNIIDRVAHIELSRGDKLNTMTPAFWRELPEIVDEISNSASARAIVISSTGKHFSAGMDLAVFTGGGVIGGANGAADEADHTDADPDPMAELGRRQANTRLQVMHLQSSFNSLENARMPVLVAIHGGCIGGAVDMVTAADMRYATEDAFFCIQEINIGMTADVGTLQRLPKLIPEGIARELAYTGRRMPAQRAAEVGLVNAVYATQAEMVDDVMNIAAEIASKSPLAIWGTKESIKFTRDHSVAESLQWIASWQSGMFQPADMGAALVAQMNKTEADYADLPPVRVGL